MRKQSLEGLWRRRARAREREIERGGGKREAALDGWMHGMMERGEERRERVEGEREIEYICREGEMATRRSAYGFLRAFV